jgi:iron complex outermembrane recepter protein
LSLTSNGAFECQHYLGSGPIFSNTNIGIEMVLPCCAIDIIPADISNNIVQGEEAVKFAQSTKFRTGSAIIAVAMAMISTSVAAQDTKADGDDKEKAIVVTGSRIKVPGLVATSPIASVGSETIALTRAVTVEDFSTRIPQLAGGVSSSVATTDSFGAQTLDLRGLGQNRTLVLINGTRAVPFSFRNSVDVSGIPATLLKRVDVLTGGAGAVYGADALSGVVNFIINNEFRGVQLSGNYRVADGGGSQYGVNGTFGVSLGDRGSIVGYAESTRRDPLLAGKRAFAVARPVTTAASAGGNFRDVVSGRTFSFDEDNNFTLTPQRSNFTNQFQLIQAVRRINASVFAEYELSDSIEAYGRFIYSNVRSTGGSPSGQGPASFSGNVNISATNPGLTPQISSLLTFVNGVANVNVNRSFPEFGIITATNTRESWQGQFGLRGDLTPAISWDAYVQHGQVNDAITINNEGDRVGLLANIATLDIFGPNPALASFTRSFNLGDRTRKQSVAAAYFTGNTSDFFDGWAGPVGFSAGFEHRRDLANFKYTQGLGAVTLRQSSLVPPEQKPKTIINEVYGELLVPVLANLPLIQKLSVEGAYRRSWYVRANRFKSSSDTSKIGASWTVSDDLRIRSTRQKVIREPNIGEWANGVDGTRPFGLWLVGPNALRPGRYAGDPCVIAGSGANLEQCARFGAPAVGSYNSLDPTQYTGTYFIGGNPNIRPERGTTLTVGGVATPRFIPGLNVSFDYYNIRIEDAVGVIQPIAAVASCYVTDPRADNPLCLAFTRNPTNGRIQDGFATDRNLGTLTNRGIDVGVNYAINLGDGGLIEKITLDYQATFVNKFSIQRNSTLAAIDCTGTFAATCSADSTAFVNPKYRHRASIALNFGAVVSQFGWTRIGKVRDSTVGSLDIIPAVDYFDLNLSIRPPVEGLTLNLGVNNLFDKQPPQPRISGSFGTYPETYDVIGRTVGLSLTLRR